MNIAMVYVIVVGIAAALVQSILWLQAAFSTPLASLVRVAKKPQSSWGYVAISIVLALAMAGFVAVFVSGALAAKAEDVAGFVIGAIVSFASVVVSLYAGFSRLLSDRCLRKAASDSSDK